MNKESPVNFQHIIHQTEDGCPRLQFRLEGKTVWLSRKRMACLESNT